MGIGRYFEGEKLIGLFNFSKFEKTTALQETEEYKELITGKEGNTAEIHLPAYGFVYLKKKG